MPQSKNNFILYTIKMVQKETYTTKEVKEVENKDLQNYSFPKEWRNIEAASYEEAVKILNSNKSE